MKHLNSRRIHFWLSIVIAIPLIIITISGILIALRGAMPTVTVPLSWSGAEGVPTVLPMTAYLEDDQQATWIGNAQGLTKIKHGNVEEIESFKGQEIVALAQFTQSAMPIVATKMAIWVYEGDAWKSPLKGRVRMLSKQQNGNILAIVGGRGEFADGKAMLTQDGIHWAPYQTAITANELLPALSDPQVALHMFMRELHSGSFFFGKGMGEWVYNSTIGAILLMLLITGMIIWIRMMIRKHYHRTT